MPLRQATLQTMPLRKETAKDRMKAKMMQATIDFDKKGKQTVIAYIDQTPLRKDLCGHSFYP